MARKALPPSDGGAACKPASQIQRSSHVQRVLPRTCGPQRGRSRCGQRTSAHTHAPGAGGAFSPGASPLRGPPRSRRPPSQRALNARIATSGGWRGAVPSQMGRGA
eukprot:CAMPEP_0171262368 /NCGR_PEP_ID=MMETSP0790-20130122/56515_1 /TAXON_ID=2925 /ORGANISM="Alexandrium catenella, Strain OF101" /LENGTH=105 /DNA_ID=CAMNT_0011730887 /DNA_START=12 /DNA_END=326 /DNA_ORIENTATION=-